MLGRGRRRAFGASPWRRRRGPPDAAPSPPAPRHPPQTSAADGQRTAYSDGSAHRQDQTTGSKQLPSTRARSNGVDVKVSRYHTVPNSQSID